MDRRTFLEGAAAAATVGVASEAVALSFTSTRVSVQVRGEGQDVILIPGLTNGRSVWDGTVRAVPGYRYHLVQVAGFAGDPAGGNASGRVVSAVAEEIARYIAEAKLKSPALIGHSMGGIVAVMVAARYPARAGKVMAVDILPSPASGFGFAGAQIAPLADALFGSLMSTPGGRRTLDNLIGTFGGSGIANSRSDSGVVARATHELATTDLTPELSKIKAPLTVVYAVPSSAQDAPAVDRLYRTSYAPAKDARLRRVPGATHMVMYSQPQRFYAEVREFLRS
ncbi:alpha/beta hydrolase [Sphingomonas sp. ID1715]|uniref:alpha/beta fold hydrolase n=1 Tax=Sphingomonas sp. ID1715 TaxID=1656898 RepID=UPI001488821D|nr:alpha/beta hydrolase [Sphingomonas sp. ID1715]NNM77518.1 alpha/beta hydrolase [Sphingomonas sp. ID1715]